MLNKGAAARRFIEAVESAMTRDITDSIPISSRDELIAYLEQGAKEPTQFRIGTEHEKIPFYRTGHRPVPYEGSFGQGGIANLLQGMQKELGFAPVTDRSRIIGLYDPASGAGISLEPGGQFELSGAPVETVHQTEAELDAHFAALKRVAGPLGIDFLALGMSPKWRREETPLMPKQRYAIMVRHMSKVGTLGLDMMLRTCTVQANFDFSSEADMVKKFRVSLALQPIATALFANSPFTDGKLNGFLSMRSEIWRHTDPARTGMLPFVFEPGMSFERYVDYAMSVPMYFVKRGDTYHDVAGADFRRFLQDGLSELPGVRATLADWINHLTTIFPEVRLKNYLEMRGVDAGRSSFLLALPALFTGLLYDPSALDASWDIVKGWSARAREQLRADVPRLGLAAMVEGRPAKEVARQILDVSRLGLAKRNRVNAQGRDESSYLAPLYKVLEETNEAERLIGKFKAEWMGDIERAFEECVY